MRSAANASAAALSRTTGTVVRVHPGFPGRLQQALSTAGVVVSWIAQRIRINVECSWKLRQKFRAAIVPALPGDGIAMSISRQEDPRRGRADDFGEGGPIAKRSRCRQVPTLATKRLFSAE
jgi:hypothetical protein